ncbi:MerR family transcriptional regulator [Sphaerochaeta sp. PS]|uniref:MerR family transcriptional regulator n=1 Tax=Sphaerochaeta sp. PS TaxID=3076336 RepID=UPI0028A5231B|nr:MerR family transcriptional regulator [Sphaerochaeta sp. PS]MDT4761104.1 MerR family transcriptional regulator [Sphaerochaeta sp. PS]
MSPNRYRIGELARKAGVTARTVRYYESLGLLKTQDRQDGGQRYYTDEDLVYLNRIIQLKRYGLTLDEIAQIIRLGNEDSTGQKRRLELLKQYRRLLSKEIQHLKAVQELIGDLSWHVEQLEGIDHDFQQCPGTACAKCEFKERCEFYEKPEGQ